MLRRAVGMEREFSLRESGLCVSDSGAAGPAASSAALIPVEPSGTGADAASSVRTVCASGTRLNALGTEKGGACEPQSDKGPEHAPHPPGCVSNNQPQYNNCQHKPACPDAHVQQSRKNSVNSSHKSFLLIMAAPPQLSAMWPEDHPKNVSQTAFFSKAAPAAAFGHVGGDIPKNMPPLPFIIDYME